MGLCDGSVKIVKTPFKKIQKSFGAAFQECSYISGKLEASTKKEEFHYG